ncbi:DNA polymerase III subunit delta [Patescibacteria group bacterium]|nr:DNA polymerase III subunit delta [Patescibacteria group bacterium]
MLILLYGEDGYRLRQKLKEIKENYQAKHQSGLSLAFFRESNLDLDRVKEKIEAVSMFDEKKLIILENPFKDKNFQKDFFDYAKTRKLKDDQEVIIVICHEDKLAVSKIKNKLSMLEEFSLLKDPALVNWVKKEFKENGASINSEALKKLIAYIGNDLWRLNGEIGKLTSYSDGKEVREEDIDLLVKANLDTNIFKTLDALARRDKPAALRLIHEHLEEGDNEMYLLSMLAYQIRSLIRLKDLIARGEPYYSLAKKSGLHPYVVKKSSDQLRNFTLDGLKNIYRRLAEIDFKIKVGLTDGPTALDLLIAEI